MTGSDEFIMSEFRRVRDEIKAGFMEFYMNVINNK
jgi:arsenate reductase